MSLINDALKRAQEAQRPNAPSSVASIRTIPTRPKERPFTGRLLIVIIFLLLSAAFAFIGLAMTGRLAKKDAGAPPMVPAQPVAVAAATAQPFAIPVPVAAAAPATPGQPKSAPAAAVVPALPPLVLPDSLHVQGIAYDPVRPWAIVSGRTVYVGDLVKGVRVMKITQNTVTFGNNGQTNFLYVGE
jgi:hypothetical protein